MTSPALNTVTLGSGERVIVILHGWGNNLEYWRAFGELLAPFATVHLIDLPGFGKSELPPKPWGVVDYAKRVVEYLKEKEIHQATFIGHSFGGRISVVLAADNPELISELVLINAHGIPPKRTFKQKFRIYYIKTLRTLIKITDTIIRTKLFEKWFAPRFGSIDYKSAGELRPTFIKVINQDLSKYAAKIKAQTLLLWGELDRETPLSIGEQYKTLIKNSELIVLKNKKHDMFLDVGGHLCLFHIKKFLQLEDRRQANNE